MSSVQLDYDLREAESATILISSGFVEGRLGDLTAVDVYMGSTPVFPGATEMHLLVLADLKWSEPESDVRRLEIALERFDPETPTLTRTNVFTEVDIEPSIRPEPPFDVVLGPLQQQALTVSLEAELRAQTLYMVSVIDPIAGIRLGCATFATLMASDETDSSDEAD